MSSSGVILCEIPRDKWYQRLVLLAEGLAPGPLTLSLSADTQGMSWLDLVPGARASYPLPAATDGADPSQQDVSQGPGVPLWGSFSWVIETCLGGVWKKWYADLVSGTYALPPCDTVRVGLQTYSREAPPQSLSVVASVAQGSPHHAGRPWTWTYVDSLVVPPSTAVLTQAFGSYLLPDFAFRWRTGVFVAPPKRTTAVEFPEAVHMPAMGATMAQVGSVDAGLEFIAALQRDWQDVPLGPTPGRVVTQLLYRNLGLGAAYLTPYITVELQP
jgi:hypothetical protein